MTTDELLEKATPQFRDYYAALCEAYPTNSIGGPLARKVAIEVWELARSNSFSAMRDALKDAIRECKEHNNEYHHRTPETMILHWEDLIK